MARKLQVELADAGCDLVCHPDEAKAYCERIRSEVGAPMPDHVILRRMNARKAN